MKIVLILSDPPLPFGSAAARWYYVLINALVRRGHRVCCFVSALAPAEVAAVRALFPPDRFDIRFHFSCRRGGLAGKASSFVRPHSYLFDKNFLFELERELSQGFDVLHLEQLWTGWAGLRHARKAVVNVHYLFDIDNDGAPARSVIERVHRIRYRQAARSILSRYPTITTVSSRLTDHVRKISPRSTVSTLPLALDLSLYKPETENPAKNAPVVGLIGSFNWQPSRSAAERLIQSLWPEIRRRVPGARLLIAGRAAKSIPGGFPPDSGVTVHEDVPDILPLFRELDVLLYAPRHGSGIKIKVLEAFALGVPVVTTPEGVEGTDARDGLEAGICREDEGLIERAVEILQSPSVGHGRARLARALLERHCAPDKVIRDLEDVYERVVQGSSFSHR